VQSVVDQDEGLAHGGVGQVLPSQRLLVDHESGVDVLELGAAPGDGRDVQRPRTGERAPVHDQVGQQWQRSTADVVSDEGHRGLGSQRAAKDRYRAADAPGR